MNKGCNRPDWSDEYNDHCICDNQSEFADLYNESCEGCRYWRSEGDDADDHG